MKNALNSKEYPFSRKLTWMNMTVSAAALVLACTLFVAFDITTFRQNSLRYASSQAEMVGSNSASALIFNDPGPAQRTVSTLSAAPNITFAGVYTLDGQPFALYSRAGVPPMAPPTIPVGVAESYQFQGGQIDLVRRIMFQGKPAGLVYIRISSDTLNDRLRLYVGISAGVLALSLLAALVVSSVFRRTVAEPIVHLAEVAQTISREKQFSVRANVPRSGKEVSILVDAFNQMLEELQKRDSALQAARDELEGRVEERTAQLRRSEQDLRSLSGRLIELQDEERRRIARELHDSTGQVLAAFAMNIALLQSESDKLSPNGVRVINETLEMAQDLSRGLRTLSYLLHPPLLEEAGLESALKWYLQGFSERSGIRASLEISPDMGRLPRDMEIAIFRIVQESLTNVHRHSGSEAAEVHVLRDAQEIRVEVRDRGKGISGTGEQLRVNPGVGIRGMRERVAQFGGKFEVVAGDLGTTVIARFALSVETADASNQPSVAAGFTDPLS